MSTEYKTIELKICPSSNKQVSRLNKFFKSATALWKHIIKHSVTDDSKVKHYKNKVFSASFVQGMVREFRSLLKSQRELKKLGKSGKIEFHPRYTVTHYAGVTVSIKSDTRIRIQKLGSFYTRGLKQLKKYPGYKIVTVKLLKRATGFYVHLTIKVKKPQTDKPQRYIGLDFGVSDAIVTSNGYKVNWLNHEKLEKRFERIARLQQQLARKVKGSRNFRKTAFLIRKAYEKAGFVKQEIHNKLVSVFRSYYLVFQNELIKLWHGGGFSSVRKRVQRLGLGGLLARLKTFEFNYVLDSSVATTKTCLQCQQKYSISLDERIYKCPNCGHTMHRDMHSALNMLRFYGFSYQECISDPSIQFPFSETEIAKLQLAGLSIQKI